MKKHQIIQGIYHKANDLVNGKHYWTSLDGKYAIWHRYAYVTNNFNDNNNKKWLIGKSKGLGGIMAYISFVTNAPCQPSSGRNFEYVNSDKDWVDAPINSISIKCV